VGGRRAALRRGEDLTPPPVGPQKAILLSVPLFHVTGLTSLAVRASLLLSVDHPDRSRIDAVDYVWHETRTDEEVEC